MVYKVFNRTVLWSASFSLVCSLYNLGVVRSILGRVAQRNFFRDFSSPTTVVPGVRMVTVGAKGEYNGCGVKKNLDYNFVS